MKIFDFDSRSYADRYRERGYVHIPGGASAEFVHHALAFAEERVAGSADERLSDWQFAGKKQQFLMEFDESCDFPDGLYRAVADVTGLDPTRMRIGERHIKIYDDDADPAPPPHKDRLASEVTVGVALRVPGASRLALFPDADLTLNPYASSAEWRDTRDERDLPENAVAGHAPVLIDTRPRDVVMFAGSAIYHERLRPARTWVLYMKFNALGLDPIGEDPATLRQRARSLEILAARTDAELLETRLEVSPRLEKVSRHYTRLHWLEVIHASILGEREFVLSEGELQLLRSLGSGRPRVRQAIERMGIATLGAPHRVPIIRRLAERGAIDLLD